jgi:hypothetical protein
MYKSNVEYKNRHGEIFRFEHIWNDCYKFVMEDAQYCRVGGRLGNSLQFFDPSGGPFISLGTAIDDKQIVQIVASGNEYLIWVETGESNEETY